MSTGQPGHRAHATGSRSGAIAILGAGAWGTALAISLAARHAVRLWARNDTVAQHLQRERCHPAVLSGALLPDGIVATSDLAAAVEGAAVVLVAAAVAGARPVLQALAGHRWHGPVVMACKGFEQASGLLPHEIATEVLAPGTPVLALSGPSFATEVAAGLPAALVLSGADAAHVEPLRHLLHHPHLRLYSNTDPTGVEIAGALKNVIAIAAGMADGMGLGLNARAALVTRGLAEIRRLGEARGARSETFLGLAGVGDLMLTCTATLSRNYRVGQALAAGDTLEAILARLGEVAEGVATARSVPRLAAQADLPICSAVASVLAGTVTPADALQALLRRDPRPEH